MKSGIVGNMWEAINSFLTKVDDFVWGPPLMILIIAGGILLTIRMGVLQVRKLPLALKWMVKNEEEGEGEVTSFGALCTALSATIGTGNIVGVATAIGAGGPGALFWMVLAAFFGMATKYAEGLLAVKYRVVDEDNHALGGPFYYIEKGMGTKWKWLAKIFAFFGICVGLFGIGTFSQVNGIASAVEGFFDPNVSYTYAPIHLSGAKIVIACSNKKRGLGDSKYNERRSECEEALRRVQKVKKVENWGALTEAEFEEIKGAIGDEVLERRAKHAVYENQRTIKAVAALQNNDITLFGELMNASHVSLRDDYEVTGIELDTLVEEAWKVPGVIGSRMTGAGFGGCTISIVRDEAIEEFIKQVGEAYEKKIGYAADFYVVEIGDGPCRLK